jgi:predicted Zn-dependent peptidase
VTGADRSRLPEVAPDPAFTFPTVARDALTGGLPVRLVEHPGLPIVTFLLLLEGGSGSDPSDLEGLAGITADMVDEGTGSLTAVDVSDALARIGAEYDVEVGPDVTTFSLTILTRFAERGASLLASLVARPSLRAEDFERVRRLRLDRIRQLRAVPTVVAERAFLRLLYGEHPYGHLAIGSDTALEALSLSDVEALHRSAFRPSQATLVVVGAMSAAELRAVAERAFGAWTDHGRPPEGAPRGAGLEPPSAPGSRLAVVDRPGAAQSEIRIGHLSAPRTTPDYPALLVLNAVLGGQFVSRVNLRLREEKGYTYGARTGFDWRRGPGPFVLQAAVHTAATADAVRDALDELSAIGGHRPPSPGELALAKASLTRGYPRSFETAAQVARGVAQLAVYGLPDSYFEEFCGRVSAVTADEVGAAAARHIVPGRLSTLVVGDVDAVGESLGRLGLGDPHTLPGA